MRQRQSESFQSTSLFRGRARKGFLGAMICAALVAAACGSSAGDKQRTAAGAKTEASEENKVGPPEGAGTSTGEAPQADPSGVPDAATGVAGSGAPAPVVSTPTNKGEGPADRKGASVGKTPGATSSAAPRLPGPASAAGAGTAEGPKGGAEPAAPVKTGPKTEIVLGSFGTQTGVIGSNMLPSHQGARAWVADVNARGGLAGHPVRLVLSDDEGDPNKALAIARRMVEQDHVIAFFVHHGPTTVQAVLPYLEEKKIPLIGSCGCAAETARSPMSFDGGSSADWGLAWSQVQGIVAFSDKRKAALLSCREVSVCSNGRKRILVAAKALGIDIVYDAQVSLVAPDYTAEVLAARSAGAEALIVLIENSGIIRVARDAHRQNYFPLISGQYSAHDERFAKNGGKDVEGAVLGGGSVDWNSPRLADMRAAVKRYVPDAVLSSSLGRAWTSGKLLERASLLGGLPDSPTSADLLRGLYALKAETLGGLIPAVTFQEGSPYESQCVVPFIIEPGGKYRPKDGDTWVCPPPGFSAK
jgi:branched-chain amino acid transport system substrate-binding protein